MAFFELPQSFVGSSPVGFTSYEIDALDFNRAAVALSELADYIEEALPVLEASKRIAERDIKRRFRTETSPDGSSWMDLDPLYEKRKVREFPGHNILSRGGKNSQHLEQTATEEGRFAISGESIFYNTDGLPDYWRVHQEGSSGFRMVTSKWTHLGKAYESTDREPSEGDQNIPPRPYIGLSAEAEAEILDAFDIWFSQGIEKAAKEFKFTSTGTLMKMEKGRFAGKAIIS
jgi:phage gpG-like protein